MGELFERKYRRLNMGNQNLVLQFNEKKTAFLKFKNVYSSTNDLLDYY